LLDRQLLTLDTPKKGPGVLVTASGATMDAARPVIERSILKRFQSPGTIDELTRDAQLIAATQDYKNKLMRMGLLPDEDLTKRRQDLATAAIAILLGTAFIKILVALSRGRWNIGFLVLLAVIFAIVAFAVTHPRLTRAGKNVLGDLKELFAGLRGRAYSFAPGKNSDEFLFLVAVFGLAAVSSTYPFAAALRASPAAALSSSTCGASMGSGCGSSSGSSCGSGCGGGGCGGGCGGCGS
jgi:uncharacterized protein (TIGR04222 family)